MSLRINFLPNERHAHSIKETKRACAVAGVAVGSSGSAAAAAAAGVGRLLGGAVAGVRPPGVPACRTAVGNTQK